MHTMTWYDYRGVHHVACDGKTAFHLVTLLEKVTKDFKVCGIHVYFLDTELDLNTGNYIIPKKD